MNVPSEQKTQGIYCYHLRKLIVKRAKGQEHQEKISPCIGAIYLSYKCTPWTLKCAIKILKYNKSNFHAIVYLLSILSH